MLLKQSSQSACLLNTCLCVNSVLYLSFGGDRKMREVVWSRGYSQLNKDLDPNSRSYLLCGLGMLFDLVSLCVIMPPTL